MKNDNANKDRNDRNNSRNKVKFILAWYNKERVKLRDGQKLLLLNRWITSCTLFEEYEMSNALLNEKRMLVRRMRISKVGERSFFNKLFLVMRVIKRTALYDLKDFKKWILNGFK